MSPPPKSCPGAVSPHSVCCPAAWPSAPASPSARKEGKTSVADFGEDGCQVITVLQHMVLQRCAPPGKGRGWIWLDDGHTVCWTTGTPPRWGILPPQTKRPRWSAEHFLSLAASSA